VFPAANPLSRDERQGHPATPQERIPVHISPLDLPTAVVTVSGPCTRTDLDELRLALVDAVDATAAETDLLVDVHAVTSFDDECLPAFVAARSRAKWNRRSLAVLGGVGGPVEVSLRRSGQILRIPVHGDVSAAREALRGQRPGVGRAPARAVDRGEHALGIANPFRRVVR
jgi:hypothetical protein